MFGFVISLGLVFGSLQAFSLGLKQGNHITVQPLDGIARVSCTDFNHVRRHKTVRCMADLVEPVLRDRFVLGQSVDADRVELVSTWQNGHVETKSSKFDGEKGESKSKFNLWINTLFQDPLLGPGRNLISYELTKKKEVVLEGNFEAYVDLKEVFMCDPDFLGFTYNCRDEIRICDDYFYFNNNCGL